jgi:hypothetical protein
VLATSQSSAWLSNPNEFNMTDMSHESSKAQAGKVYYQKQFERDEKEKLLVKASRKKSSSATACNSSSSAKPQHLPHHTHLHHHHQQQQHRQASTNSSPIVTIKPRPTSKLADEFAEDYMAFPIPSTPNQSTMKKASTLSHKSNQPRQEQPSTTTTSNSSHLMSAEFFAELERILSKQFNPLIICLVKTLKNNEKMFAEKENDEIIQSEWSDVAMIIDRILCYAFSIITLTSCVLIFNNSPNVLSDW